MSASAVNTDRTCSAAPPAPAASPHRPCWAPIRAAILQWPAAPAPTRRLP